MTVLHPLAPIRLTEFTHYSSVTFRNGGWAYVTGADNLCSFVLDNLKPGLPLRYSITVETDADTWMVLRAGRSASTGGGRTHLLQGTMTSGTTLPVDLSGARSGLIRASFWYILDDEVGLRPTDRLSLQAYFPVQDTNALRWNVSRWGSQRWNGPRAGIVFAWDFAAWNTVPWEGVSREVEAWQDITAPCTQIDVTRGVKSEGPAYLAQVGTLTATAINALAPRETGMRQGTPVRLVHWPSRQVMFTGTVTDLECTPYKPGGSIRYKTIITASDVVAQMASTMRYGARGAGTLGMELWSERLARLMQGRPYLLNFSTPRAPVKNPWVPGVVWETNLAKHLDGLCCSVRGAWHVTRDGMINVYSELGNTPSMTFTDDSDLSRASVPPVMWYTDLDGGWRATDVVARVTLENHACKVENGEWRADDTTVSHDDVTGSEVWGGTEIRVPTTRLAADLPALAAEYITKRARDWVPSSLTLRPRTTLDILRCVDMESLRAVTVEYNGDSHPARITRVTHRLTPTQWVTKLNFAPR